MTLRTVTFKTELDLLEQLDRYALRYRLNRSEAIRKAIEEMVRDEFTKDTIAVAKVVKCERIG
jgi:metal-responsive CopG/Arc/MetJ family transcriptional regulator